MRSFWFIILLTLLAQKIAVCEMEVTYEVFSIPMSQAAKLKRENLTGEESYQRLLDLAEKSEASQKVWMTAKTRIDQGTTLEEVKEMIFPTEMEPQELPNMVGTGFSKPFPAPVIPLPPTATSFDTKKTGDILEVSLKKADQSLRVKLRYSKTRLVQLDEYGKGTSRVKMPRFAVQRHSTEATVVPDKPTLVGTISPPKDLQTEKEKRVWLPYITVTKSKD